MSEGTTTPPDTVSAPPPTEAAPAPVAHPVRRPRVDRNSWLFGVFGLMLGFVLAYFLYEAVGENQPPRLQAPVAQGAQASADQRLPGGRPQGALPPGATQPGTAQSGTAQPSPGQPGVGGLPQDGGFGSGPVNAPVMQQQLDALYRGMEQNRDDAAAWLDVANLAYELRRWDVAVDAYQKYLRLAGDEPDIMSDLAVSLHGAGRSDEALETFHRAQALAPDHWQSRFNEVVVLLDLGRDEAAQAKTEELVEMRPGDETVRRLAAEVARRNAG